MKKKSRRILFLTLIIWMGSITYPPIFMSVHAEGLLDTTSETGDTKSTQKSTIFPKKDPRGMSTVSIMEESEESKVTSITFANQFPNPHTAQVIAEQFSKEPTDIIDSSMLERTQFNLYNNNLTDITGIEIFQQLTLLEVPYNKLTDLPDSIGQLKNLTNLDVSGNQLVNLPGSIGQLTNLISLDVSDNQLKSLPDSIGQLDSLTDIFMYKNQLTSLPESIGQLNNLMILYAYDTQLTNLPVSIGQLRNLKSLSLGDNQLTSLPDNIGQLTNLTVLDVSDNQLVSLPDSIGHLTNVMYWGMSGNLLPDNTWDILQSLGLTGSMPEIVSDALKVTKKEPLLISNVSDIRSDVLALYAGLYSNKNMSTSHTFILEDYVDAMGHPVNIADYFSLEGHVIKSGNIYAQIRATGTGLFPNTSEHALTKDSVPLNFKASVPNEFIITVHYVDTEGNKLTESVSLKGKFGDAYTTEQKEFNGYTFKEIKGNGTGTFTDEKQEVTYVYTKNPVTSPSITVHYVDIEGNKLTESVSLKGKFGDAYTTEQKEFNGYTFKEIKGNGTGTFTDEEQEVTYVYTKVKVNIILPPSEKINKLENNSTNEKKVSESLKNKNIKTQFPQTGEQIFQSIWGFIGLVLLVSAGFIFIPRIKV